MIKLINKNTTRIAKNFVRFSQVWLPNKFTSHFSPLVSWVHICLPLIDTFQIRVDLNFYSLHFNNLHFYTKFWCNHFH